jgi:hypothetical protein
MTKVRRDCHRLASNALHQRDNRARKRAVVALVNPGLGPGAKKKKRNEQRRVSANKCRAELYRQGLTARGTVRIKQGHPTGDAHRASRGRTIRMGVGAPPLRSPESEDSTVPMPNVLKLSEEDPISPVVDAKLLIPLSSLCNGAEAASITTSQLHARDEEALRGASWPGFPEAGTFSGQMVHGCNQYQLKADLFDPTGKDVRKLINDGIKIFVQNWVRTIPIKWADVIESVTNGTQKLYRIFKEDKGEMDIVGFVILRRNRHYVEVDLIGTVGGMYDPLLHRHRRNGVGKAVINWLKGIYKCISLKCYNFNALFYFKQHFILDSRDRRRQEHFAKKVKDANCDPKAFEDAYNKFPKRYRWAKDLIPLYWCATT